MQTRDGLTLQLRSGGCRDKTDVAFTVELGFTPGLAPVLEPGTTPGATTALADARDERIYGVLVTPDGLDIRVESSGCSFTWAQLGVTKARARLANPIWKMDVS